MLLCAIYLFHLNKAVDIEAKCLVDVIYCIQRSKYMVVAR